MKKLALMFVSSFLLLGLAGVVLADETAYFKIGPLELNVPLKTADVVYLFNGLAKTSAKQSLVGGETTIGKLWDKVSLTAGVVTTVGAQGIPFLGSDIAVGNALDKFLSLGQIRVGGWGGYSFRDKEAMGGLKCSLKLW